MAGMDFITVIPKTKLIMKNIARFEYLKHIHSHTYIQNFGMVKIYSNLSGYLTN